MMPGLAGWSRTRPGWAERAVLAPPLRVLLPGHPGRPRHPRAPRARRAVAGGSQDGGGSQYSRATNRYHSFLRAVRRRPGKHPSHARRSSGRLGRGGCSSEAVLRKLHSVPEAWRALSGLMLGESLTADCASVGAPAARGRGRLVARVLRPAFSCGASHGDWDWDWERSAPWLLFLLLLLPSIPGGPGTNDPPLLPLEWKGTPAGSGSRFPAPFERTSVLSTKLVSPSTERIDISFPFTRPTPIDRSIGPA